MNKVFTVIDKKFLSLVEIMTKSLFRHNTCTLYMGIVGINNVSKVSLDKIRRISPSIVLFSVDCKSWLNNRMAHRLELLSNMPMYENEIVYVLDADLYIRDDIFKWFDANTDILLTTRPEFNLTVNGGVWGYRWNDRGKRFIQFFLEQMHDITWGSLKEFQKKWEHLEAGRDWWLDQDFLCCVNDIGLKFPCNIKRLHCRTHNCSPRKDNIGASIENLDKKILHFKGSLKKVWVDYYNRNLS